MCKYIYPNLANFIEETTVDNYKSVYVAEVKKTGWRCLAWKKDGKLELWTRRHTLIDYPLPITREYLMQLPDNTMVDGELLDKRTKNIKDHYYAFDVLYIEGESLMHLPYSARREKLELLISHYGVGVELAKPVQLGFSAYYKKAVADGYEGIVIKNIYSKYLIDLKSCPHNPQWFKAKRPVNSFMNKK